MKIVSSKQTVAPWVAKKLFGRFNPDEAIGLEKNGELVAGVIYENWNRRSIVCHIVIDGRMTPSYLAAIFHYPFMYLGVDKIIAPVAESNEESIKFVENLGFEREATLSDAHPDGAILLYTIKRTACRFIGERYASRLVVAAQGECHRQGQP